MSYLHVYNVFVFVSVLELQTIAGGINVLVLHHIVNIYLSKFVYVFVFVYVFLF